MGNRSEAISIYLTQSSNTACTYGIYGKDAIMPSKLIDGYQFFFYSNERNEPPHMHVRKGGNETKIWLGTLGFAYNHGFGEHELTRIRRMTRRHLDELFDLWDGHFAG